MAFQVIDDLKKADELWEAGLIWWRRTEQADWHVDKYVPGYRAPSYTPHFQFAIQLED